MEYEDNEFLEDPFEWLIELNNQVFQLTDQHNRLVHDYQATLERLKQCEKQITDLQHQIIFLTNQ